MSVFFFLRNYLFQFDDNDDTLILPANYLVEIFKYNCFYLKKIKNKNVLYNYH